MTRAREHTTGHGTSFWVRRHGDGLQLVPSDSCEERGGEGLRHRLSPHGPPGTGQDSGLARFPPRPACSVGIVMRGVAGDTVSGVRRLLLLFLWEKPSL